jgi:hypothetical protein
MTGRHISTDCSRRYGPRAMYLDQPRQRNDSALAASRPKDQSAPPPVANDTLPARSGVSPAAIPLEPARRGGNPEMAIWQRLTTQSKIFSRLPIDKYIKYMYT